MINIKNLVMGALDNNVYIVTCTPEGDEVGERAESAEGIAVADVGTPENAEVFETPAQKEVFVVDPSDNTEKIAAQIAQIAQIEQMQTGHAGKPEQAKQTDGAQNLKAIVCTHFHSDHTGGLAKLAAITKAPVWAGAQDAQNIETPKGASKNSVRLHAACKVDVRAKDGDVLRVGGTNWHVIHTPGHSKGGICLYAPPQENDVLINGKNYGKIPLLFSGDTLFKGTTGRTDFLGGSEADMKASLEKLSKLPDDTLVLPGHNDYTTIANERTTTFPRWGV